MMRKLLYILILSVMILFAGCADNGTDPEATPEWKAINSGLTSTTIQCIAPSQSDSKILYVGTIGGVFRTDDGGSSWTAKNSGLTSQDAKALVVHPDNSNLVFLGTWGKGVFKSSNGGNSWVSIWDNSFDPRVYALALGSNGFLWAASKNGLYKSADQGASWTLTYDEDNIISVSLNPANPKELFIGVQYQGNYKTTDNGNTWQAVNSGIYGDPNSETGILAGNCFTFDPTRTTTIYLSTGSVDIYKTTSSGGFWEQFPKDKSDFKVLSTVVDPLDPETIWAATENLGILKSENGGESWADVNTGLPTTRTKVVAFSGGDSPQIYAGTVGEGMFKYSE